MTSSESPDLHCPRLVCLIGAVGLVLAGLAAGYPLPTSERIAWQRHSGMANYLYLDGHAKTLDWSVAVIDMFPDKNVFTDDMSYP
ncbi:MAG TPA: hypothetical protein VHC22_18705 [Pirellulales bacterium]|nr:hypothetical protein [Pirellulales bacterium]